MNRKKVLVATPRLIKAKTVKILSDAYIELESSIDLAASSIVDHALFQPPFLDAVFPYRGDGDGSWDAAKKRRPEDKD